MFGWFTSGTVACQGIPMHLYDLSSTNLNASVGSVLAFPYWFVFGSNSCQDFVIIFLWCIPYFGLLWPENVTKIWRSKTGPNTHGR